MFLAGLVSRASAHARLARAASTQARGRSAILQKNADDVVITFAKRTAMGRAKKGQLKDIPVDELLHALFKVCVHPRQGVSMVANCDKTTLEKTRLDPAKIDDICVGE